VALNRQIRLRSRPVDVPEGDNIALTSRVSLRGALPYLLLSSPITASAFRICCATSRSGCAKDRSSTASR
jgi:hypothetical protein